MSFVNRYVNALCEKAKKTSELASNKVENLGYIGDGNLARASGERIQQHRALYDRLSIGKQAAKGWFAKRPVDAMINQAEKGLH